MRVRHLAVATGVAVLVSITTGDASTSRLKVEVSPRFSSAPSVVRVRAIVTPSEQNRALRIEADSDSYYRSSLIQLDGVDAPAVTETTLKDLPGGEYSVTVTLLESDGHRTTEQRTVLVMPRPGR